MIYVGCGTFVRQMMRKVFSMLHNINVCLMSIYFYIFDLLWNSLNGSEFIS